MRRIEQRPRSRVVLVDDAGVFLAQAEVDPRKLGFRCRASWADGELAIRRKFWDSTRFNVDADGKVGELETSPYGGDGGTATLVYAQGRLTLEARRALFLGALLVDLLDDGGDESEHVETGASYALARFLSRDTILE